MPCQLPDDLSCVTDDVFSYMCSLAMEKCSKKSEKKKASCGGAAMRKRLLIKNFVAQMLAQERQNCSNSYAMNCSKSEYEMHELDTCGLPNVVVLKPGSVSKGFKNLIEDEDDEGEEGADEDDEDDDCSNTFASSSNYSNNSPLFPPNYINRQSKKDDEDEEEEEEEEETEEEDYEDEEEEEENDSERCSTSTDSMLAANNYSSMNTQCTTLMSSASSLYMQNSSVISGTASGQYATVIANNQFDDSMSACSSIMSPVCASSLYTAAHFYDSSGVAMSAVPVPGSSVSMNDGCLSSMSAIGCMSSASRSSEWEDFHTVPPSRDYLMDDDSSHSQENNGMLYSMYQSYPSVSNAPNTSLHFQPQQPQQLSCASSLPLMPSNNSTLTSVCVMNPSTNNIASNTDKHCDTLAISSDSVISNCSETTSNSFTVVETLPENFLDDTSTKSTDIESASSIMWGDEKKEVINDLCFWDDNNNDGNGNERKSDLIYGGLNTIPQHMTVSSSSPPPPSSALHNLVTMVPSMIKFGSCRNEVHQNESNYRRCITDLDTNTVVEEEYGNNTNCLLSNGSSFHHLNLNSSNINGYSPRKRPLSPFFIEHINSAHELMEDDLSSVDGSGSANGNVCGLMMLTTSPKRVKL